MFGGSTARARDAAPAEQHAVADRAFAANGLRDWEASRMCWEGRIGSLAPRHAKPESARKRTYTVKAGDTLSKIATAHGTTWKALYAANCGVVENPSKIYPGEILHV